ncbi:uncharacterized protein LOC143029590 [Oratosquilla oratoria]|uniref:uncharacterized protein LOC143029590 n=1 Tax=Oratosquilla oratoria TaxID=337810 RepID=UPI003F75A891
MHPTAVFVACLAITIGSVISYPVLVFEQSGDSTSNKRVRSLKCENSGSSVRCSEETEQGMEESLLEVIGPSGGPYVIIEEAEIRTAMEDAAAGIREKPAPLKSGPYIMTQDTCPEGTVYVSEIDLCLPVEDDDDDDDEEEEEQQEKAESLRSQEQHSRELEDSSSQSPCSDESMEDGKCLEMKPPTTTTTPRPWSQVFVECKENEIYLSELDICVPADNCFPYPDCSQVPTTPKPQRPYRVSDIFDDDSRSSPLYSAPSKKDRVAATHIRIMDPVPAGSSTTRNEISFADLIKSTYDFKNNLV